MDLTKNLTTWGMLEFQRCAALENTAMNAYCGIGKATAFGVASAPIP
jgi:hypothetical protein